MKQITLKRLQKIRAEARALMSGIAPLLDIQYEELNNKAAKDIETYKSRIREGRIVARADSGVWVSPGSGPNSTCECELGLRYCYGQYNGTGCSNNNDSDCLQSKTSCHPNANPCDTTPNGQGNCDGKHADSSCKGPTMFQCSGNEPTSRSCGGVGPSAPSVVCGITRNEDLESEEDNDIDESTLNAQIFISDIIDNPSLFFTNRSIIEKTRESRKKAFQNKNSALARAMPRADTSCQTLPNCIPPSEGECK